MNEDFKKSFVFDDWHPVWPVSVAMPSDMRYPSTDTYNFKWY